MIGGMKLVLSILEAMDKYGIWAVLTGVVILIGYLKLQNTIVQYNSKANQQIELIYF